MHPLVFLAIIALLIILVVIVVVLSAGTSEHFLPTQTWTDWDNYAQMYGGTRAYYGALDPEGGWHGNPHSPMNDPTGLGYGAQTPNYNAYGRSGLARFPQEVNLASASDSELASEYRKGILATR